MLARKQPHVQNNGECGIKSQVDHINSTECRRSKGRRKSENDGSLFRPKPEEPTRYSCVNILNLDTGHRARVDKSNSTQQTAQHWLCHMATTVPSSSTERTCRLHAAGDRQPVHLLQHLNRDDRMFVKGTQNAIEDLAISAGRCGATHSS